jgi:hypothetical protein
MFHFVIILLLFRLISLQSVSLPFELIYSVMFLLRKELVGN